MISAYSVFSAVIFYNLSLLLVFILRRSTRFLAEYSTSALLLITILGLVRLFTPLDFKLAIIVPSSHLIPALQRAVQFEFPVLHINVSAVLLIVWGCGTVGFILRYVILELRSYRLRRSYTTIVDERAEKIASCLSKKCIVKVSPDVKEPYVAGIFRPVIYLPHIKLTDEDLCFILRHELQHVLSRDWLKKLFFLAIEALFWWNPISHITMREIDAILEFQCDMKITSGLDDKAVYEYMRTLLSVLKQVGYADAQKASCTAHFAGATPVIKQRFEVMLNRNKRQAKGLNILLCCTVVVCFFLSYMFILQPRFSPPEGDLGGVFEITAENSFILDKDGTFYFYCNGDFVDMLNENDLGRAPYNQIEIVEGD